LESGKLVISNDKTSGVLSFGLNAMSGAEQVSVKAIFAGYSAARP
jgi:hypothetical protein